MDRFVGSGGDDIFKGLKDLYCNLVYIFFFLWDMLWDFFYKMVDYGYEFKNNVV